MDLTATPRGRRGLFAALYLCEGAPIGFLWWALPVVLAERGAAAEDIGAILGALALPWALKFLWAPLVDVLRGPRWTLRAWILASQAAMVLTLLPLLSPDALSDPARLFLPLVLHAFAAATQDVAIDALCVRSAPEAERGSLNGWMQTGMLVGRATFGGGALLLRGRFGDPALVGALIAVIALTGLLGLVYRDPSRSHVAERLRSFVQHGRAALASRTTWIALLYAATAGAGFEAVGGFAGPLLRHGGASTESIGAFLSFASVGAMAAGALSGGRLADAFGRRRVVATSGLALAGAVLAVAWAAGALRSPGALMALMTVMYLAIGLYTASSYALFMDVTDPRLGSVQFSAYMGATNLCEAWAAYAAGAWITAHGYGFALAACAAVSILATALVPFVRAARPARSQSGAAID